MFKIHFQWRIRWRITSIIRIIEEISCITNQFSLNSLRKIPPNLPEPRGRMNFNTNPDIAEMMNATAIKMSMIVFVFGDAISNSSYGRFIYLMWGV